nr:amidohydrolase family protein [uncultured Devosia sp.]
MKRDYTLIDTHAHIFRSDLPMSPEGLHYPKTNFEVDDYLAILDDHGVENACIAAPSFLGTFNDYMIDVLTEHRRLRGTVIVRPDIDRYVLRQMDQDGVVGVRLSLRGSKQLPDLDSADYQRLFHRIADLNWHVHLHIEGERLPQVLPALTRSPANLVVDHFGRPDPKLGAQSQGFEHLLNAFDTGRTWCKLSGGFRIGCDPMPLAKKLLEVAGPSHLVWGSDCPFTDYETRVSYASVVASFEEWVPSKEDRQTIAETTKQLYRF